jgi:NAD(P)-dependent dehydrogenase (short-subunit alcohol dehydrogenase family)
MLDGVQRTPWLQRRNGMAGKQSVVVTGVSTGIGWGITKVLLGKGFRVFGSVRKEADADRLQREFGSGFSPLIMDVTDSDAVDGAAVRVSSQLGSGTLAGLVNNAGVAVPGPLLYLPLEAFRRQLEVNLIAPLSVTQAFAPLLGTDRKRKGPAGRVINISSVGGKIGMPFLGAYVASKFGLEGMSETLRRELMLFGIDVIVVGPGSVATAIWDKGEAEDMTAYEKTEYKDILEQFRKYAVAEGRRGLTPERLGQAVYRALTTAHPRTRYAVVPQRFKSWTLPRLLPTRMLDRMIGKQLGLTGAHS